MIRGELVTLRAIGPADFQRMTDFSNDVEVELLGGRRPPRPHTLASVTERATSSASSEDDVTFAIDVAGVFIGDCGLFRLNRVNGTAELGIGIGDRNAWGKGYGRDAVSALVHYGFIMQNLRKIWLEVNGTNERAIRCYRSVGFIEEGRQSQQVWSAGQYLDLVLMGLLRDDWLTYRKPIRPPRHLNPTDDPD
jgi:RimJ/RimL family protein N-acetyltransferase